MNSNQVMQQVNEIFIDVLDDPKIVLTESTTATDIPEWDSLNHIQLVVAIEKKFKLKFTSQQIQGWKDVGAMCSDISKNLGQA